jgi:hypothetical protein
MLLDPYWGIDENQKIENRWYLLALLQGTESFARGLTAMKRVPAPEPLKFSIIPANEEHDSRVAKFYICCLRALVDAWIESGRDREHEDHEDPCARHLTMPLQNALNHWAGERHPELSFQESGKPVLELPASRMRNDDAPFRAAWENALQYFAQFLDSPDRYLIAKCRNQACTYYYAQRMPRGPLKYGTYCPAHRQQASAARSVYRSRSDLKKTRLKIARSLWGKWPPSAKSEKQQRSWLVEKLNEKQDPDNPPIKINWVTRNLEEIATGQLTNQDNGERKSASRTGRK